MQQPLNLVRILIIVGFYALFFTGVSKVVLGIFAAVYFLAWMISISSGEDEKPIDAMSAVGPTLIRNLIGSLFWLVAMFIVFAIIEPSAQVPYHAVGAMMMFAIALCLIALYPEVYDEEARELSVF